jgi:hypothetical protein
MEMQIGVQSITKGNPIDMNMKKVRKEPNLSSCWTRTRVLFHPIRGAYPSTITSMTEFMNYVRPNVQKLNHMHSRKNILQAFTNSI